MQIIHSLNQLPKKSQRLQLRYFIFHPLPQSAIIAYLQKDINFALLFNISIVPQNITILQFFITFQNLNLPLAGLFLGNDFDGNHTTHIKRKPSENFAVSSHLKGSLIVDGVLLVDSRPLFGNVGVEHALKNIFQHLNNITKLLLVDIISSNE